MSYKSLLFCPDEKTARAVTQVLSELEFTIELSNEPFATVKKLTDEHFDALVVDCQNEQDAGLLFKAARNSTLNHSSLSVAVVEGQAGVAKAFRIGANLVLTKPINIEQSKGTLRVARGLLRKNEVKAAAASATKSAGAASMAPSISAPLLPARPSAQEPATFSAVNPAAMKPAIPTGPSAPYAALELDKEPTPAPEASEVALLESLPNPIDGKSATTSEPLWAPRSQGQAEPIAASTGGHAAAAAPALEKPVEFRLAGAPPMVTQEPIVAENGAAEHFPVASIPVPTFSSDLGANPSSSSDVGKFLKNVVVVLILFVAGYMAWQRLQPLQYLHGSTAGQPVKQPVVAPEPIPTSAPIPAASQSPTNPENGTPDGADSTETSALTVVPSSSKPAAGSSAPAHNPPETIRVQELPLNSEPKTSLPPRPQPIVVQAKPGNSAATRAVQQPTPPSLPVTSTSNSEAALSSIVTANVSAPKPGSFRISQGVSQGLVVKKVAPVYSATALQLRKEGPVELMATISKEGAVTGVRVLSGDLMLAKSAVEAVKQWKYRPYLLNGEPVEIETQITVNFRLPH
jgi:protein TonB